MPMNNPEIQTRDLVTRNLHLRAETVDDKTRTVEATLTTESPAEVWDWEKWDTIQEVLRVDGMQAPGQVPLLESHRRGSSADVLGSIRDISIDGEEVRGRLYFVEGDADVDRVWNKVRQGAITDVSVGYRVTNFVDIPAEGKAEIGGKSYMAGKKALRVSTAWILKEGSIVPIGADPAAKLREENQITGATPQNEKEKAIMEIEETKATGAPPEGERAAPPPAPVTPAPPPVDVEAERAAAREQERKRQAAIRALGTKHAVDQETVERALTEDMDESAAALLFLEARAANQPPPVASGAPGVIAPDHDARRTLEVLESALLHRIGCKGVPHIPKHVGEETRAKLAALAERSFEYARMDGRDILEQCVRLDGVKDPKTGTRPLGNDGMFRAAVSGSTLTSIFTTSVNARLLAGFEQTPDTTDWVAERDVADFKTQTDISLGKTAQLKKLARGGTATHADISDEEETYRIYRYAQKFVVDEQDQIDDALGAIARVPFEMGMAAGRMRGDLVYSLIIANPTLTDTGALFNSTAETTAGGHANLGTSAFDATALKAAITVFTKRKQGEANLNIQPVYLVVVPTLLWDAKQVINPAQLVAAGTTDVLLPSVNTLADVGLNIRSDARLENGVTDPTTETVRSGSTTRWFLAADPNAIPTLTLAFLAGTGRVPQTNNWTLSEGQWGMGWAIKYDIGAAALGYRGLYMGKV